MATPQPPVRDTERIFSGDWTLEISKIRDRYVAELSKHVDPHKRSDGRGYGYDKESFVYSKARQWKFRGMEYRDHDDIRYFLDQPRQGSDIDFATLTISKPALIKKFLEDIDGLEAKYKPTVRLRINDHPFLPAPSAAQTELSLGFKIPPTAPKMIPGIEQVLDDCGINRRTAHHLQPYQEYEFTNGQPDASKTEYNLLMEERIMRVLDMRKGVSAARGK